MSQSSTKIWGTIMIKIVGFFIGSLFLLSSVGYAERIIAQGDPVALTIPGEYYMGPKWSPDGEQIAAAGASYTGLYLFDFPTGNMQVLSTTYSAGYGFAWSHGGSQIAAKISEYENMRRKHTLVSIDVADVTQRVLSSPRSMMSGRPRWSSDDAYLYLTFTNKFESFHLNESTRSALEPTHHFVKEGHFQERNGDLDIPLFTDQDRIYSYEISPDGTKIAYSTSGQRLWLADISGENVINLGRGMSPSWAPDGAWITFMFNEDDGHSITHSDIYVVKADGSSRMNLTNSDDMIEMNPQWSPDGAWIVFDTDRLGQIFIQQVDRR